MSVDFDAYEDVYGNPFKAVASAVTRARVLNAALDSTVEKVVKLMVGRLRTVHDYSGCEALAKLKKELKEFDARQKRWRK